MHRHGAVEAAAGGTKVSGNLGAAAFLAYALLSIRMSTPGDRLGNSGVDRSFENVQESCAAETSVESEVSVTKLRMVLDDTSLVASRTRRDLHLPASIGATHSIVSDTSVCHAIRVKLDSLLTNNFQPGLVRPDSTRSLAVLRVDSVYVVGDLEGNRVGGVPGMTVLSLSFAIIARFR